jgi:hypothetical protein
MRSLNMAYGEQERRSFLTFSATAFNLTLGMLLLMALLLGIVVALPAAAGNRADYGSNYYLPVRTVPTKSQMAMGYTRRRHCHIAVACGLCRILPLYQQFCEL